MMCYFFPEKKFKIDSDDSDEEEELSLSDDGELLNAGMRQWTRT
jgi:hypothetical protein